MSRGVSPVLADVLIVSVAIAVVVFMYHFVACFESADTASSASKVSVVLSVPPRVDLAMYDANTSELHLVLRSDSPVSSLSIYVKGADGTIIAAATDVNAISCAGRLCTVDTNMAIPSDCSDCSVVVGTPAGVSIATPLQVVRALGSGASASSKSTNTTTSPGASAFSDWEYNKIITIDYNGTAPLVYYQIRVELNSSNFNFSYAKPDGSDVRFADTNLEELNYWIQEWNASQRHAVIWVNIPRIDSPETNILMFYGNPDATSESNGYRTFVVFEDFTNKPVDWNWPGLYADVNTEQGLLYLRMKDNSNQQYYTRFPQSPSELGVIVLARTKMITTGSFPDVGLGIYGSTPNENTAPRTIRFNFSKYPSGTASIGYTSSSGKYTTLSNKSYPFTVLTTGYRVLSLCKYGLTVSASIDSNILFHVTLPEDFNVENVGLFDDLDSGDTQVVDWIAAGYCDPSVTVKIR
ncbi:MAG: DUF2341 domain-containing protein [Candidatus Diapherotrites archaeon]|nr:DUF2341 domain-containing protein [Candidatus Diapherotrites archaeon]